MWRPGVKYTNEYENAKNSTLTPEDVDLRLAKRRGKMPVICESDDAWHAEHKAIAINGYWYDVTNFIPEHPGGDVILHYLRSDCTSTFYGMHPWPDKILAKRFPIAIHKTDKPYLETNSKINLVYWRLYQRYKELGLFHRSQTWLAGLMTMCMAMGAVSFWTAYYYPKNWFQNGVIAGNFLLASAFLTHDSCHSYVTENKTFSKIISWWYGDVIFGVSSRWWKEEHDEHHGITNTFDEARKTVTDRQACEDFWCQNDQIVSWFRAFYHPLVIRVQHITTLPLALFFARIGIQVDCWISSELMNWHWKNLIGCALHWTWVIILCHWHESPWLYYFAFSTYQGTLAIQLIGSHIYRPFIPLDGARYVSFAQRMTEVTINYKSSQWTDWFFGGLHFHIEHHIWPKMPRYNLRVINYDMKKFMKEFDIAYEYKWIWVVFGEMNAHLKKIGKVWLADYNKTKKIKEQ